MKLEELEKLFGVKFANWQNAIYFWRDPDSSFLPEVDYDVVENYFSLCLKNKILGRTKDLKEVSRFIKKYNSLKNFI